uniref:Uncharacterized protein n=1 Tax=Anguilla anguilla TaxID=7936 RepID=A0A0E9XXW9_ANGAN
MTGTRPHNPAVYTSPPSNAMASASLRMIFLMQSSTVGAVAHLILSFSDSATMLKSHLSHFLVSSCPTAHHFTGLASRFMSVPAFCSERTMLIYSAPR